VREQLGAEAVLTIIQCDMCPPFFDIKPSGRKPSEAIQDESWQESILAESLLRE